MKKNHFRTEAEWRRWFDDAEQRAQRSQTSTSEVIASTPAIERKWISGLETAGSSLKLSYSKPFPLRRRRGR